MEEITTKKQKTEQLKYLSGLYTKSTNNWNIDIDKTISELNLNITREPIYKLESPITFTGNLQILMEKYKNMDFINLKDKDIIDCDNIFIRQILLTIRSINMTDSKRIEAQVDQFVYDIIKEILGQFVVKHKNILLQVISKVNLTFPVKGIKDYNVTSIPDYVLATSNDLYCLIIEDKDKKFLAFGQAIGECLAAIVKNTLNPKSKNWIFKEPFPFIIVSGSDFIFGSLYITQEYLDEFRAGHIPQNSIRLNINCNNDEDGGKYHFIGLDFNRPSSRLIILNTLYSMIEKVIMRCEKYML